MGGCGGGGEGVRSNGRRRSASTNHKFPRVHDGSAMIFTMLEKGLVWWGDHNRLTDDSFENVAPDGQKQFWFAARERNGPDGADFDKKSAMRKELKDLIGGKKPGTGGSQMRDWF